MYLTPSLELIQFMIEFNKQAKIFEYSLILLRKASIRKQKAVAIRFSTKIYPDIEFFM